jgi:multidrug efflux pump subunit AcrA (membrane-fusion protein)
LTAAAVGWGFFGSVTTSAQGLGILTDPSGIDNITAEGSGLVTEILVTPGQRVTKGQVVARLGQPLLKTEIKGVEADVQRLRDDYEQSSKLYEEGDRLYRKATQQQRTNIAFSIEALERRQKALRETHKASQEALTKQRTRSADQAAHPAGSNRDGPGTAAPGGQGPGRSHARPARPRRLDPEGAGCRGP